MKKNGLNLKRLWVVTLILFSIFSYNFSISIYGDDKPITELIEDSTQDGVPAIRLAASLALVRTYYLLDKPLSELQAITTNTKAEGAETGELLHAITYAQNGDYISICRKERELPQRIKSMDLGQLKRNALYGSRSETRAKAASAIMKIVIESVGVDFNNYYRFRISHEEKFDGIKLELEREWTTYSLITRNWENHKIKELTEEVADTLGRMYLAEYLITLKSSFVQDKVNCKSENGDNGEDQ